MFVRLFRAWQQWSLLKKGVVTFVFLFIAHSVIGFLILPYVMKDQLQKRGTVICARKVEVEDVFINPYLFRARITGFKVHGKNNESVLLSFTELSGTIHWLPLVFTQTLKFSTVRLDNPVVRLTRYPDGLLNISDVLSRGAGERPLREMADVRKKLVNLALADVSLVNGSIVIDDQLKSVSHEITAINFGLPTLSDHDDKVDEIVTPTFSAIVNGTLFDFSGESKPFANDHVTGVEFSSENLDLTVLNPYLPEGIPFRLAEGELDFAIQAKSLYIPDENRLDLTLQGEVRLHDVIVEDLEGGRFAAVSSVDLSLESADLFTHSLKFNSIQVQQPELYVERLKDGSIKFASLVSGAKQEGATPPPDFLAECKKFSIQGARLIVIDHVPTAMTTHRLEQVDVTLQNFSTAEEHPFDFDVNLLAGGSGHLSLKGQAGLSPLFVKLEGDLQKFPLVAGQNYIAEQAVVVLDDGTVSAIFSGSANMTDGLDFSMEAAVQVDDLVVLHGKGKPEVIGLRSMQTEVLVQNNPPSLKVKSVDLNNPRAHVELQKNGVLNIATLVKEKGEPTNEPPQKLDLREYLGKDGKITLGTLSVVHGQLFVEDRSISPSYHVEISEIDGSVSGVSTLVDEGGAFAFAALFDHHSPLVLDGHANPFPPNRFIDADMAFSDIEMSPFSPYSQKFIGRDLVKGKLSLKQHIGVKNRLLDVNTSIYLDQLGLGKYEANDTATGLPVGLAVALLQDRHGVISFDVPIEGSLDDPEFGLGGAVVSVVVNLITKAATSPFSLIGSMFEGDGESQFVVFSAGLADIDAKQREALISFAKVLYDRPGLKVEIASQYNVLQEQQTLLQSKFMGVLQVEKTNVAGTNSVEINVGTDEFAIYLLAAYKNAEFERPRNMLGLLVEQSPSEMERMLKANIEIPLGELRLLAMQRGEAVASLLRINGPVESERLFVLEPAQIDARTPQVELRLQ